MRIATYNTQAGLPGTHIGDILRAYRYVFRIKSFPHQIQTGMRQAVQKTMSLDADVLCLNEIPTSWIGIVQSLLAEHGYQYFASSITQSWLRWSVGTLLASKHRAQSFPLHLPRENTLRGGGGSAALYLPDLHNTLVVGVHLGWEVPGFKKIIEEQIISLARFCQAKLKLGIRVIIAGDFNKENLANTPLLNDVGLKEMLLDPTYPSWHPRRRLDHILCDPTFNIVRQSTFRGNSDHLGLFADIENL